MVTTTNQAGKARARRKGGVATSNRDLGLLRAAFNWGIRLDYVDATPFKKFTETVVKLTKESTRRRQLEGDEGERLMEACDPLQGVRRLHHADLAVGYGRVVLPGALDRKYPPACTDWSWQFVFPAGRICRDERFGPPTRFHLHESVVQRAVTEAGRRAGLAKRVGCHTFRALVRHTPARKRV